jgi:hypothetical protein
MTGLLVVLAVGAGPAWGAPIQLDTFSDDVFVSVTGISPPNPNTVSQPPPPLSGILGGQRTVTLDVTGTPSAFAISQAYIDNGSIPNRLTLNSPTNANATLTLDYPNIGIRDLSGQTLTIAVDTNDNGGTWTLGLDDGSGFVYANVSLGVDGAPTSLAIAVDGTNFPGVDLQHVTNISLAFAGNTATDITFGLDLPTNDPPPPPVIPEPASLALWGLMGLGSVVFARRRKAAVAQG